jgi:hypothetical protein
LIAAELQSRDIPCRRYNVEPGMEDLEDLELQLDGVTHRLRIVRTGQH